MSITLENNEGACIIRFAGEIDVSCSSELKRMLMETITSVKDLRLDLERASDLDITTLQLIWAAARELEKAGKALTLHDRVPEAIVGAIREAGFEKFPGLPVSNPPIAESPEVHVALPAKSERDD